MWRAALLALSVVLLASPVASARVLQTVTPSDRLADGPVLAGARVAWEENRCASPGACGFEAATRYRIRAAGPGGVRTLSQGRIRSLPGGSNAFFSSVSFELSTRHFVLARSEFGTLGEQDFASERLYAGGRDGSALVRLVRCRVDQQAVEAPFALAGVLLAYDPVPCDERPRLTVRDLATATSRAIELVPADGSLHDVALAGRFVATVHGGVVQLHDAQTGAVLFSAPLPPGLLHAIDVASDGRLAVSVGSERTGRRSCWRSRLYIRPAGAAGLELQPGRPCWDARLVHDGAAYLAGERRPTRLEFLGAADARRTVVAFGARRARENFDAQGSRAAVALGCNGRVRIRVVSLGERAPAC